MTPEKEQGSGISDYFKNKNIRTLLLSVVTIMTITLFVWTYTDQTKIDSYKRIRVEHAEESVHETIKLKMEALPPIPVKIMLEQQTPKPTPLDNKTKKEDLKWDYNWDHRQLKNPEDVHKIPSRTVYLIRHGQYNYSDGHLNEMGRTQVKKTAQRLKELNRPFGCIIHSTLDRARETAEIIHQEFPSISMWSDDLLKEGGPIPPKPTITYWGLPERDYFVDGPRLEAAFRKYFYRADTNQQYQSFDIIVGHANIFRYFVLRGLQLEKSAWMRLGTAHASITSITVNPDSLVLVSMLGDSGHLPANMVTY